MQNQITYTLPYETEKDIEKAEKIQALLYKKFTNVRVCMAGFFTLQIIANNEF